MDIIFTFLRWFIYPCRNVPPQKLLEMIMNLLFFSIGVNHSGEGMFECGSALIEELEYAPLAAQFWTPCDANSCFSSRLD